MPRIAWFSPLGTTWHGELCLTHGAQWSGALLPHLPANWDVELFVDDDDLMEFTLHDNVDESFYGPHRLWSFHRAFLRHRAKPFDFAIYHLEDHPKCWFVQQQLRLWPGLCYFHDLGLSQLYRSYFRHSTGGTDLDAMMCDLFDADAPRVGQWQVRRWPIEILDEMRVCGKREQRQAAVRLFSHWLWESRLKSAGMEEGNEIIPELRLAEEKVPSTEAKHIGFSPLPMNAAGILETVQGVQEFLARTAALEVQLLWLCKTQSERTFALSWLERESQRRPELRNVLQLVDASSEETFAHALQSCRAFVSLQAHSFHGISPLVRLSLRNSISTVIYDYDGIASTEEKSSAHLLCRLPLSGQGVPAALADELEKIFTATPQDRLLLNSPEGYRFAAEHMEKLLAIVEKHAARLCHGFATAEAVIGACREQLLDDAAQEFDRPRWSERAQSLSEEILRSAVKDFHWGNV